MAKVLPNIYHTYQDKYAGYTIRRLCQEMHDFYKERKVNVLQKHLFLKTISHIQYEPAGSEL